jgi:hypothetical protein
MRTIAELNVLLRERIELPVGMKLATEEFNEGWMFMLTGDAPRLKRKIQARGWNFVRIADGSLRSGVGDTSEEAIANGLKLALRHISAQFNAVEVERIELTQYPWFCLARVRVYPYLIQAEAAQPEWDEPATDLIGNRQQKFRQRADEIMPSFSSAMPQLKEMLVLSDSSEARAQ